MVKHDKLGRRIPEYDRSAAGKKAAKTRKEKHGNDSHRRAGSLGGRSRTRGYLGRLKDTDPDKLKEITSKGGKTGKKYFQKLAEENPEELREISVKGRKAQLRRTADSRKATPKKTVDE